MITLRIPKFTRLLRPPADWDEELNGPCSSLAIRDTIIQNMPFMVSMHEPTPEELKQLIDGEPILLGQAGYTYSPSFLFVGRLD